MLLSVLIAGLTGSASAFFLWALDAVTTLRWAHPWLLGCLPIFGILIVLGYERYGQPAGRGTNLILDAFHEPTTAIPRRLAPFVLGSTLLTHLGGGSAGREGTAVQMGAGLAAAIIRGFRVVAFPVQRQLLLTGIAAGFGAVFGTPWAGALFALEFLRHDSVLGWVRLDSTSRQSLLATAPLTVLAGWVGHGVCLAWGIRHTAYAVTSQPWTRSALVTAVALGLSAGLVARFYVAVTERISAAAQRSLRQSWQRPVLGALIIFAMSWILGTDAYLGLGVTHPRPDQPSLVTAFFAGGATPWSWLWKLALTAVTLGTGFKGGEVTPLFFIGATLGNTVATWTGLPVDLAAATGFVSVFAGASRTPLACAVMGAELFGGRFGPGLLLACVAALATANQHGIYPAQRTSKRHRPAAD